MWRFLVPLGWFLQAIGPELSLITGGRVGISLVSYSHGAYSGRAYSGCQILLRRDRYRMWQRKSKIIPSGFYGYIVMGV